jgi:hypothetical protein
VRLSPARLRILGAITIAAALVLPTGTALAGSTSRHHQRNYTCTGGDIPSGTYANITVRGACAVPADAVIKVLGSINVKAGAVLDAQSAPSTIWVGRNVFAAPGSTLGLGCQPPDYVGNSAHPCTVEPTGHSVITVRGSVLAVGAAFVAINGISVGRDLTVWGGGSPTPWSIKNNTVRGNVTVVGLTVEWIGVMFNHVGRNVLIANVTVNDVDPGAPGVYIVQNVIGWNLACWNLVPGVSGGFVPGAVNTVGHRAYGQCAALV